MLRILLFLILFSTALELHASTTQSPTSVIIDTYRVQANGSRFAVGLQDNELMNPAGCSSSSAQRTFYIVRPTRTTQ